MGGGTREPGAGGASREARAGRREPGGASREARAGREPGGASRARAGRREPGGARREARAGRRDATRRARGGAGAPGPWRPSRDAAPRGPPRWGARPRTGDEPGDESPAPVLPHVRTRVGPSHRATTYRTTHRTWGQYRVPSRCWVVHRTWRQPSRAVSSHAPAPKLSERRDLCTLCEAGAPGLEMRPPCFTGVTRFDSRQLHAEMCGMPVAHRTSIHLNRFHLGQHK